MRILLKNNSEYKFSKIFSIMEMNEVIVVIGKVIPSQRYKVFLIHKEIIANCKEIIEQLKTSRRVKK